MDKSQQNNPKEDQHDHYSHQNKRLRELHEQRIRRQAEQVVDGTLKYTLEADEEEKLEKYIKVPALTSSKPCAEEDRDTIWLNSVLYDRRDINQKINAIRLPSLFQKNPRVMPHEIMSEEIEAILISTFGFEMETFLPIAKSGKQLLVVNMQRENPEGAVDHNYSGFENMKVISPPKRKKGYGVFHTKLWLIKFGTFLRVVVGTGNNHVNDWTVWQNAYWFNDFPLKQEQRMEKTESQSQQEKQGKQCQFNFAQDFVETLNLVLKQMQPKEIDICKTMKINLNHYDFKDVNIVLIPSVPGKFSGEQLSRFGLSKIKSVMKMCNPNFKPAILTYCSTSLGKFDRGFLNQIYESFSSSSSVNSDNFRLIYPTNRYIKQQTCGESAVLFLTRENYLASDLSNSMFYRYEQSAQNGVLGGIPHLKTIIVEDSDSNNCVFYVGSHNMTKAAWGTYKSQKSNGVIVEKQVTYLNSQLGILFVNYQMKKLFQWLPFKYPPLKYGPTQRPFLRQL